jgi:flagellar biosynthesis GTPase FlhF
MRKILLGTMFFALLIVVPTATMAEVNVGVHIALPPLIVFQGPPEVIVIPDTPDVYVAPDIEVDLFFWSGWWWRPWEGRWYRSHYYDRGWVYYSHVPRFYFDVDPGWRGYYRHHDWYGHRWNYERIPNHQLQQNWKKWHNDRHWERHGTWGVQSYQPRPKEQRQELRHQREQEYQRRPEVQQHQQQRQQQQKQHPAQQPQNRNQKPQQSQRQPQVQQPSHQPPHEKAQQPESREQRYQGHKSQDSKPQKKHEEREMEHKQ